MYANWTEKEDVGYTVRYLEQGTEKVLATEKTVTNKKFNSVQTETAKAVTGYTPVEESKNITLDAYGKTLTFYYTANRYTVRFNANFDGADPATKDQQMVYDIDGSKTKLSANTFTRTGYSFVKWTVNSDGTGASYEDEEEVSNLTSENNGVVNLYANWTEKEDVGYTVRYLEQGTEKVLATEKTVTNKKFNSVQTETAVSVTGYTPVEETKNITLDAYGKTLTFYYTANRYTVRFNANFDGADPATKDQQMVYDIDGSKTKLSANTFTRTGYSFVKWTVNSDGTGASYEDEEEVSNLTSENNGVVNLYANWTEKEDVGYTVRYLEKDTGKVLADEITRTNKTLNGTYTETAVSITGYTPDEETKQITLDTNGKVLTFYYTIQEGTVTAKYVDENGNKIREDIILTGDIGEDYKTEKLDFEIYEFEEVEGNEEGKFSSKDIVVIYKYNKKSGRIIIIYQDPDGEVIKPNDIITGKIGEDYSVDRQIVDGYELIEIIGNEKGTYQLADQFVMYKYKKIENPITLPQTGQSRIVYIAVGIIIIISILGLIYIKIDDSKSKK